MSPLRKTNVNQKLGGVPENGKNRAKHAVKVLPERDRERERESLDKLESKGRINE